MPGKGYKLSNKSIEQMKKSKLKKLLSKFKWEIIEPYYDIRLNMSSRNRKLIFITLREFRKKIEEGKSLENMRKEGISKHLLSFYSKLSQGKINLTKEKFIEEYETGLSLDEIAEKYKINKGKMTYLRQLYEIKIKGPTFINRKKTETLLTQEQKEILYGSMMGDAKKMSPSTVGFVHGPAQQKYLLWKFKIFENVSSKNSLKAIKSIDFRSEYESTRWRFYTNANTDIEKCVLEFYETGQKKITMSILNKLTPLSIAVWFQDDAKTDFQHREKMRTGFNMTPVSKFCTDSFSKESCDNIVKWFYDKYNIKTELKEKPLSNRMGYRVQICNEDTYKFFDLIRPHILPMFQYKINYEEYCKYRKDKESEVIMDKVINCPLGVDFSTLPPIKQDSYISNIVNYYHKKGIESLVNKPDKWEDHMLSVLNQNPNNLLRSDYISFSNLGNKFLMSHFPHFWATRAKGNQSPKEIFNNKEYLSEIIRTIISQGYFPNESKILKSLHRYRGNKTLSGFMPCVAKSIYHKYCKENNKVIDFCSGYGGRLFGAIACDKVDSYTGIEVNFDTYSGLHDLYRTLRLHAEIKKEVNIINQDSILGMTQFSDKSFDFCFTSPPYFNAEEYSNEKNQSFKKYSTYGEWFDNYLIKSIQEARRISKKVAINIANSGGYRIADDLENWFRKNNIFYEINQIRMPQYGGKHRFEPIFIFS